MEEDLLKFKFSLHQTCLEILSARVQNARAAMDQAQETANDQEKSSAGDKYETSRAMGQLDRDMNARQLEKALAELSLIKTIDPAKIQTEINKGSVFELTGTLFFVAAGLGSVKAGAKTVIVISPQSPFYEQVKSKTKGDEIVFQNVKQKIKTVF